MINSLIDPPECRYSEQELARAKWEIAAEKWENMDEDACEFLLDHADAYLIALVRGGDHANEARADAERDCVGYLAEYVPIARAIAWLR